MKTLIKINNEEELAYDFDGFILGVKGYSLSFEKYYAINEIKKIISNTKKEIYVSLNRPIFNNELEDYKKTLKELDKLGLKGIIVGDIATLTYNLNTNIILDQMHLNNSYLTIKHYQNNGVKGIVLTNDITKEEINLIKDKTNILLFKQVFGYEHISTSVRKLVTNYLDTFEIKSNSDRFYIKEESSDKYYNIKEDYFGTHIYSDKVLNIIDIKDELNVDCLVLDSHLIDKNIMKEIYKDYLSNNFTEISKKIEGYNGFIDTKTIYKVKNNE